MNAFWTAALSAGGIVFAALLTYLATRGRDKTGGVNAYIDQLQEDRTADREELRLQKAEWAKERKKLIEDFVGEIAQMKAAFVVERNELRAELDAALADVRTLRQQIASISVVRTLEPPPGKEKP